MDHRAYGYGSLYSPAGRDLSALPVPAGEIQSTAVLSYGISFISQRNISLTCDPICMLYRQSLFTVFRIVGHR